MYKALMDTLRKFTEDSVDTGIADATSTVNYLDDSSKSWPVDAFTDLIIEITEGTGVGQITKISANTAARITFTTAFTTAPDATSWYRIALCKTITEIDTVTINLLLGKATTFTTSGPTIGNTSTTALAANANRKNATFVNDSDETIYLARGATAVMHQGPRLNANGGSFEINANNLYTGIVTGICASGGKVLCVEEGV